MTAAEIVRFCRNARVQGFSAGVTETIAAVEAVRAVDSASEKFALRATLCSSKREWDDFDRLFESFPRPAYVTGQLHKHTDPRGLWLLTGRSTEASALQS